MPRILQINEESRKEIIKVKKFAVENIYDEKYVAGILSGINPPPGDIPDHVVHFHDGFRAVYSVTKIKEDLYHHLSLSYNNDWINIPEAITILKEFGIANDIHDLDNVCPEIKMNAMNFLKRFEDET